MKRETKEDIINSLIIGVLFGGWVILTYLAHTHS
jgi:hypothetical protein